MAVRTESHSTARISVPGNRGIKVVRSCTILKPAEELYEFWRNLENISRIAKHPITVTRLDGQHSHWTVSAPWGEHKVEWTAEIINDEPGRLLAWRSLENADVPNAGSIRFTPAPGDQGTEVTVQLEYDPPGGRLAALFATLSGEAPKQQMADTLRRFKALMETGEIPTTEGQPRGRGRPSRAKKKPEGATP